MSRLTTLQRELLISINKCPDGAFEPAVAEKATSGLIRRGLLLRAPQSDGINLLIITDAGRVACNVPASAPGERPRAAITLRESAAEGGAAATHERPQQLGSAPAEVLPPASIVAAAAKHALTRLSPALKVSTPSVPTGPKGKVGTLVELLRQPGGTTLAEMMTETGWQAHSVRGTLSGAIKGKLRLQVISTQTEGARVYSIASDAAA